MPIDSIYGFSDAARFLDRAAKNRRQSRDLAVTFSRQPAYDALWEAWQTTQEIDLDGEGAEPVLQETYVTARLLIESLPSEIPSPTISAELDGHISLEWYKHRRKVLSISVSPKGTLYWSALFGTEDPRGTCHFYDEVPASLLYFIRRVCFE